MTEIAGVIVASPYTNAAPHRPQEYDEGLPPVRPPQKCHQCENAAFAAIIHAQGNGDVFQ
jgi:hypothetical protein